MNELSEEELKKFSAYIKKILGINIGQGKKMLIFSRLKNTVEKMGFSNFSQYYDFLVNDKSGKVLNEFVDIITTNHTYFMRENKHFTFFEETVLPFIYEKHNDSKSLKLWCAGCSSGEEAYTLQFIIQDFFENKNKGWNTKILATDISGKVLDKAVAGIYEKESTSDMPKKYIQNFFNSYSDDKYIVKDNIKDKIIFRKLNLMDEAWPIKKNLQVIFCRNVIIYFDEKTKDKLVNRFYEYLEQGGYLFIGHSENITDKKFEYIRSSVYRKL